MSKKEGFSDITNHAIDGTVMICCGTIRKIPTPPYGEKTIEGSVA